MQSTRVAKHPESVKELMRWDSTILSILAACLLLATACFFLRFSWEMLSTSLWNDEIYSILNYSSQGPAATLTRYIPNNHILFNLILSLIPRSASFDPARARVVSHVAILLLAILQLVYFGKRGQFAVGVLSLQPLLGNYEFLDLNLQARGYGLAALFSCAAAICFIEIWDRPTAKGAFWFAAVNALGIATIPTFVFWSVPIYALLLAKHRTACILISCSGAAALTLVIHAAVLPQMLDQALGRYGVQWGAQFSTVSAVFDSVRLFFIGSADATDARLAWCLLLAFFLAVQVASHSARSPELQLLMSVLAAFSLCLTIKTPLVRTTAFLAPPLAVALCGLFALFLEKTALSRAARLLLAAVPLVLFLIRDVRKPPGCERRDEMM